MLGPAAGRRAPGQSSLPSIVPTNQPTNQPTSQPTNQNQPTNQPPKTAHPQDACIQLEVHDPTLLAPALKKTLSVLSALPAMESFVADVCAVTFRSGLPFCPPEIARGGLNPGAAPRALEAWLRALRQGEGLRALLLRLRDALAARVDGFEEGGGTEEEGEEAGGGATGGEREAAALLAGGRAMVEAVEELVGWLVGCLVVEWYGPVGCVLDWCQSASPNLQPYHYTHQVSSETSALAAQEVLEAARGLMAHQPEGLLQRLVAHCQKLLDSPDLEVGHARVEGVRARCMPPWCEPR